MSEHPIERCGYTITPVLSRDGTFNPTTGTPRISKDSAHTDFPARIYADLADVDDDIVQGILASLFYMPDEPQPPGILDMLAAQCAPLLGHAVRVQSVQPRLEVTKVVSYVTVSRELLDEARSIFRVPTPEERAEAEARHAAYKARKKAEHAEAVTEWEQLREQHAGSPAVVAVLDIHHPDDEGRMECAHLTFGYEADAEDWPCTTYTAIKEATP